MSYFQSCYAVFYPVTISATTLSPFLLMSKRNRRKAFTTQSQLTQDAKQPFEAFTFGEPTAVLDKRDIMKYAECIHNGRWYEPPVSFHGLAKSLRSAVHHSSPLYVKRNILASTFIPHPLLSQQEFSSGCT